MILQLKSVLEEHRKLNLGEKNQIFTSKQVLFIESRRDSRFVSNSGVWRPLLPRRHDVTAPSLLTLHSSFQFITNTELRHSFILILIDKYLELGAMLSVKSLSKRFIDECVNATILKFK